VLGNQELLWFLPAMLVGAAVRHLQVRRQQRTA